MFVIYRNFIPLLYLYQINLIYCKLYLNIKYENYINLDFNIKVRSQKFLDKTVFFNYYTLNILYFKT